MHRLATWVGPRHRSKAQRKSSLRYGTRPSQPSGGMEKKKDVEATGPCRVDFGSGDVDVFNSTSWCNDEGTTACNDNAITGRLIPKSFDHSLVPNNDRALPIPRMDPPVPPSVALAEQNPGNTSRPRRSKSVFGTLSKKLRSRARAPSVRHTPKDCPSPSPQTQLSRRQTTYRPQAVPVALSDDPVARERREAALRSRGLLPPRQPRDLSVIEADADRRIDALRKSDSPLSSSATENGHSDANEIAQAWRTRNSNWLTYTPRNSESTVDPMTEGASLLDMPSHPEGSSEPPTMSADTPALVLPDGPSSISNSSLPDSPAHLFEADSSRGSIGHPESSLSRAASLSSKGPEGLTPLSSNLRDLATGNLKGGTSGDTTSDFTQLAPILPPSSVTSCVVGSQDVRMPELSGSSQCSVSPSPQSEDLQPLRSLDQLPSKPHNPTVQAKLSIPAPSPLYLHTTGSETFLPSPTTPTLSPSVCCSSSETETEDVFATAENGELGISPVSPVSLMVKNKGGLCQETILERAEPLSDDDDVDEFHTPPNTALPTVDAPSTTDGRSTPKRRTGFLSRLKSRRSTLAPPRLSSGLSKPTSMVNLRREVSSSFFARTRRLSVASNLDAAPRSPPPSPLAVKVYDGPGLSAEASMIDDDEARRLSELAFMT